MISHPALKDYSFLIVLSLVISEYSQFSGNFLVATSVASPHNCYFYWLAEPVLDRSGRVCTP